MISHQTIDRQEIINLFHQLMQPNSQLRLLHVLGNAKLGKTHLVTKVFPKLAREMYRSHYAVLDLRNQTQTITDILHAICGLLNPDIPFRAYNTAHQEWISRPKVNVVGLQALLSFVQVKSESEADDRRKMIRHLITQFVTDLRNITDTPLLLLFDQVDDANEITRSWLLDTLLVQLVPLAHLRVVVAGRSIPEPSSSYSANCQSYELQPVWEEEAYIEYCRQIGVDLEENTIRDFARAFDYKPGQFADVMPKFLTRETAHG